MRERFQATVEDRLERKCAAGSRGDPSPNSEHPHRWSSQSSDWIRSGASKGACLSETMLVTGGREATGKSRPRVGEYTHG